MSVMTGSQQRVANRKDGKAIVGGVLALVAIACSVVYLVMMFTTTLPYVEPEMRSALLVHVFLVFLHQAPLLFIGIAALKQKRSMLKGAAAFHLGTQIMMIVRMFTSIGSIGYIFAAPGPLVELLSCVIGAVAAVMLLMLVSRKKASAPGVGLKVLPGILMLMAFVLLFVSYSMQFGMSIGEFASFLFSNEGAPFSVRHVILIDLLAGLAYLFVGLADFAGWDDQTAAYRPASAVAGVPGAQGTAPGWQAATGPAGQFRQPEAASRPRPRFCAECGRPLDPEEKFCRKCGARIV